MDFGFATLLDKFEEHFGRKATKVFLGLIVFAVFGVCMNLIWANIASPLYDIYSSYIDPDQAVEWRKITSIIYNIILFIYLLNFISNFITSKKERRDLEKLTDRYSGYAEYVADFYSYADAHFRRMDALENALKERLNDAKRKNLIEIIDSMRTELEGCKSKLTEKIIALNEVVSASKIAHQADKPQSPQFDENTLNRSEEDTRL